MTVPANGDVAERALRERLHFLASKFGQANLARKTGTSRSNVNRYLSGTQLPAWFCTALCEAFAISPAWLMQGRGEPLASSVKHNAADPWLALSEAISAVTKLQLGALAGNLDARRLRELHEASEAAARIRKRLEETSGKPLADLCNQIDSAIRAGEFTRARGLRDQGEVLASLAGQTEPVVRFRYLSAAIENVAGHPEKAAQEIKRVVMLSLTIGQTPNEATFRRFFSLASAQFNRGDLQTSRAMLHALETLLPADPQQSPLAAYVRVMLSDIAALEGNLEEARRLFFAHYQCASREFAESCAASLVLTCYFSGLCDFDQACALGTMGASKAASLLRTAVWLEDSHALEAVLEGARRFKGWPEPGAHRTLIRMRATAKALHAAKTGGKCSVAALRRQLADIPGAPLHRLRDEILCLQVQQILQPRLPAATLKKLWAQVQALKPLELGHLWKATLHRSALRGQGRGYAALAAQARLFFLDAIERGTPVFASLLQPR